MGDIRAGLEELKLDGALFANVKYYVSGEGDTKVCFSFQSHISSSLRITSVALQSFSLSSLEPSKNDFKIRSRSRLFLFYFFLSPYVVVVKRPSNKETISPVSTQSRSLVAFCLGWNFRSKFKKFERIFELISIFPK